MTLRSMDILKKDAIEAYGTQQALADALGISRTAVTMWSNDRPIPREHQLRLQYELMPERFGAKARDQNETISAS